VSNSKYFAGDKCSFLGLPLEILMLNQPTIVNILTKSISMGGNFGVIFIVLNYLSPEMIGFYYTFYSLIFLRFFSELGLNFAVVQIISQSTALGDPDFVQSYVRIFIRLFFIASIGFIIVACPTILIFHSEYQQIENYYIRILFPWFTLAIATGASVFLNGLVSIIEGHQDFLLVSRLRLNYSLILNSAIAIGLVAGWELWSLAVGSWLAILFLGRGIVRVRHFYVKGERKSKISWLAEIWPFQWRLAASWISGFFIFYFLTPYVLKTNGPVAAGQLGLSLQLFLALNSISIIFISTYSARYGNLVGQQLFGQMDKFFLKNSMLSFGFVFMLLFVFWIVKLEIDEYPNNNFSNRILPNSLLVLLSVACVCNHVFLAANYYLRSFKDESLWVVSTLGAIFIIATTYKFLADGSLTSAVLIYTYTSAIFWIILAVPYSFLRRRELIINLRKMHKSRSGDHNATNT
jgi:O-antigen/teichoic acid export membrane protein